MIATPDDVFLVLRRAPLDDEEEELVARQIEAYQAEMEDHLSRSVEQREFTEGLVARRGRVGVLRGPIVSVSAVEVDGIALTSGAWVIRGRDEVEMWAADGATVVVTYEGGWPPDRTARARDAIIGRAARFAATMASGMAGVASESVEGDGIKRSVTYANAQDSGAGGLSFSAAELAGVSALKLRVLA